MFPDTSIELIKFEALFDECLKETIQASNEYYIIRILSQKNSFCPFYQKRKSFEKKNGRLPAVIVQEKWREIYEEYLDLTITNSKPNDQK